MIGGSNLFGSLFPPHFERFWEMVFRFAMGIAYLRWDRSGNLVLNRNFEILDPSDKVVISYKFGKAFAKFYSERVFHIANLHNVDPLIKQGIVILNPNSKKRADLIGQDGNGDWYVFEAKGRSRYVQVSDKQKAKRQAENIMLINNLPPRLKIACISRLNYTEISSYLIDPHGKKKITLSFSEDEFYKSYYELFYQFSKQLKFTEYPLFSAYELSLNKLMHKVPGMPSSLVSSILRSKKISIGWMERLAVLLRKKKYKKIINFYKENCEIILRIQQKLSSESNECIYSFGIDGFFIKVSRKQEEKAGV